jgi:hypothetical protein
MCIQENDNFYATEKEIQMLETVLVTLQEENLFLKQH